MALYTALRLDALDAIAPVWIGTIGGTRLGMAFLPAAVSGYWSLGDRTSLAAFWFPAVIWMLSILDGTDASAMPDRTGLALLAALAAMFVVYLCVREERRVALWRAVA